MAIATIDMIRVVERARGGNAVVRDLDANSSILEDAGLDSLQLINLILLTEATFDVEFDIDSLQISHLSTIERFTNFVNNL